MQLFYSVHVVDYPNCKGYYEITVLCGNEVINKAGTYTYHRNTLIQSYIPSWSSYKIAGNLFQTKDTDI